MRIHVLNQFGGVYADVDDTPLIPIRVNIPKLGIVTTHHQKQPDGQFAVCNSPIMSIAGHAVLKKMIADLPQAYHDAMEGKMSILHSTGPYLFTRALEATYSFMTEKLSIDELRNQLNIPKGKVPDEVLTGALEFVRGEVQQAGLYIRFGHAGSWKEY